MVALGVLVVATGAAQSLPPSAGPGGVEVSAARFYRPGAAETLVDVFCRVPLALLDRLVLGPPGGQAVYRIAVSVRDSSGLELVKQSWAQVVAADVLRVPGAQTTEHFAFAARAGRYAVEVTVTDSATGRVSRKRVEVRAFGGPPSASDLLLASGMRAAGDAVDTVPRGGEIRKGELFIQTSGDPVLTPEQSRLGYYEEVYPARAESAAVTLRVLNAAGRQVIATPPQRVALGAGGGVAEGLVDLAGLPPGQYRLEAVVTAPDSAIVRDAEFGVAGFETAAKLAELARPVSTDPFASLSEAQLDSLYAPLVYLMKADEQGIFSTLTVDGKRTYLRRFWASRNPNPSAGKNDEMDRFYAYVREANARYGEGGMSRVPGWRTDRGRIFIRDGPPDEVLNRAQSGPTKPYEVWKYTRGRPRKYIFMDLTQFGNYTLIYSDDRTEPTLPNWDVLLGTEAMDDAMRF